MSTAGQANVRCLTKIPRLPIDDQANEKIAL